MKNKGAKQRSKKKGSENAFDCDLTEHLQNSGKDGKLVSFDVYYVASLFQQISADFIMSHNNDLMNSECKQTVTATEPNYWSIII